jgi:hypothetical protein
MIARVVVAFGGCVAALVGCGVSDGPGRVSAEGPDRATFATPGALLVDRCGSLDCHGSTVRNYRLFGVGGARLDPAHRPDAPATTAGELAADYDATVSLEPEIVQRVARGEVPALELTLVRKATAREAHTGGARLAIGGDGDRCLAGWLSRRADDEACRRALAASSSTTP